jgi:hypothetical protein
MAIVTDPDNLDRKQVIFGTVDELLSLYPVGSMAHANASGEYGSTTSGAKTFTDLSGTFQTWSISSGDMLCVFGGLNAGHYKIISVDSETQVTLDTPNFVDGDTNQYYEVRENAGGSIADGVTEQALYSFSKEEWKTDSEEYMGDDLIRHEFPFIMITPNKAEIGGGLAHGSWDYFNYYTRKKIRHGGWERINSSNVTIELYSGMVSLGPMDSDAQAYYQQSGATANPTNFEFQGTVNEAVFIWDSSYDYTTYFKAFLRKKGKSYASYNLLSEQGYISIDNDRYQFPLSHLPDPAIVDTDGEILGTSPYTNRSTADSGSSGVTTIGTSTFSESGQNFLSTVEVGDVLYISGVGDDAGYYEVLSVDDNETLTVDTWELDGGVFAGDSGLTWTIYTRYIIGTPSSPRTDGVLADIDGDTGTLDSATAGFSGVVNADDLVIIVEDGSDHRGVYKVVSVTDDDTLVLNTSDKPFTSVGSIDFYIVEPGMYFQYMWDEVSLSSTGNLTFADANPDTIERASGSWSGDGVEVGDVITISGTTNNDGSYTVATVGTNLLTLVATDSLTAEGPISCTKNVYRGFRRTLNGVVYGFKWRLLANDGTLAQCYQFHQHQMRQPDDIDWGPGIARGDITDLMLTFVDPNATTTNLVIDDLAATGVNNITYYDATGVARTEKYVAAGTITFNDNLVSDGVAIYHMFFLNDDDGDDSGRDYGTPQAITVKDNSDVDIKGTISGASVSFSYDYDNNQQRGVGSEQKDADVVVVCIGLTKACFVRADGVIERSKTNLIPCVATLERNYTT